MTWGEAGVGKTTFCSKLAQDWAGIVKGRSTGTEKLTEEQRHLLSNIGLVLYIVFRDTHENQSLDDIVQSQVFDAIGEYSIRISEKKYHKDILIVCDGLDEVSWEHGKLLEIIAGRMYPKVRCIVTCRPHASLGMSLTADAEIRLKGFSKKQARHFVDMYFRQKHLSNPKLAKRESNKLWNEIESSSGLQEMAIYPSMLQLLCKLFSATGKIAKDKATIFKDYTNYLLQQYHIKNYKKDSSESFLNKMYKETLLKAGKLALQGLKQSHLQLVFTKESVETLAGKEMFDIGFVTELPVYGNEKRKVQFQHKTHQEYLAAYFIVNSPEDVGMKYLMEFCSASKGLMGSQIILTFTTAMSKKMGKVVQKQIRELVSSWASEDDVSAKDRTSFLLTMLKENKSLVFPLPKEIYINIRDYEKSSGWFQRLLHRFGKKGTLEKFFSLDDRGVEKIGIVLGRDYRLELLNSFHSFQLQKVLINFQHTTFTKDTVHLRNVIESNKKLETLSMTKLLTQDIVDICNTPEFILCIETSKHLKVIQIFECELDMNDELADALKHIPSHIELDMSGNRFTDQSGCITLLKKVRHLHSLTVQDCGIIIDTKIAETISQLPEKNKLDLSGNIVAKMDHNLLCHVIPVVSNKKVDISGLGVVIDGKVAEVICSLPIEADVDISDNTITQMDINLLSKLLYRLNKDSKVTLSNATSAIETSLPQAIHCKRDSTNLDISCNDIYKQDVIIAFLLTSDYWKQIIMRDDENKNEHEKLETLYQLSAQTNLKLHSSMTNQMKPGIVSLILSHEEEAVCTGTLTVHEQFAVPLMVHVLKQVHLDIIISKISDQTFCVNVSKATTLPSLNISNCDITLDKDIVDTMVNLYGDVNVSGNIISDQGVCIDLLNMSKQLKSLQMCNCGIQITNEIANVVSRLSDHTKLDLSGNQVIDKFACTTLIYKAASMKSLRICDCGIHIDTEIAETVSKLPDHTELDLSGNLVTDKSACITMVQNASRMKFLSICNCGIKIDTTIAEAVSKLLPDGAVLDLSCNDIIHMEPYLVSRILPYVTKQDKIDISRWGITVDVDLVRSFSQLSKMKTLIINCCYDRSENNNTVTSRAAAELPYTVRLLPQLLMLDLLDCGISDEIGVALTESLHKHNSLLEFLSLSHNLLSSGVWEVVEHIQQMKNLKRLWLGGNPCVEDDTQRDKICTALHRSNPDLVFFL